MLNSGAELSAALSVTASERAFVGVGAIKMRVSRCSFQSPSHLHIKAQPSRSLESADLGLTCFIQQPSARQFVCVVRVVLLLFSYPFSFQVGK